MVAMLNLYYLLAAIAYLTIQTSAIKFTRELQFETQNAYTVSIRSNIYTVSKNETHMKIVSSDKNFKPCTIAIDPKRNHIDGAIRAATLGKKKIIVYGVDRVDDKHTIKFVHHTVLLVDPFSCSSKYLEEADHDKVPIHFPVSGAQVVPLTAAKFDVFFLGPQKCAPCRFNAEGTEIPLKNQVKSDFTPLTEFYVKGLQRSAGYVYAVDYEDNTAALKVLDKDFKVINEQSLNHSIFDLSTNSGTKASYIGLTYKTAQSRNKFFYALYDSTLRQLFAKPLPSLGSDYRGLGAQFNIDSNGNSYISFMQLPKKGPIKVSLVIFDATGNKIADYNDFAEIPTGGSEIQTLLVEDREYCFVMHEFGEPHDVTKVKCVNTKSMCD